jgi:hypothetical protein
LLAQKKQKKQKVVSEAHACVAKTHILPNNTLLHVACVAKTHILPNNTLLHVASTYFILCRYSNNIGKDSLLHKYIISKKLLAYI